MAQPLHLKWALGLWVAEVLRQRYLSITFDFSLDSQQSKSEVSLLLHFFGCCSRLGAPPDQDSQAVFCAHFAWGLKPSSEAKIATPWIKCPYNSFPSVVTQWEGGLACGYWWLLTPVHFHAAWCYAGQGLEGSQVSSASILGFQIHVQH